MDSRRVLGRGCNLVAAAALLGRAGRETMLTRTLFHNTVTDIYEILLCSGNLGGFGHLERSSVNPENKGDLGEQRNGPRPSNGLIVRLPGRPVDLNGFLS